MEEQKFLGMPKHVAIGISWLFFPLGIIILCVEKGKVNHQEKNQIISGFICEGLAIAVSIVFSIFTTIFFAIAADVLGVLFNIIGEIVSLAILALVVFCAVKSFMNNYFTVPVVTDFAEKFIHDEPQTVDATAEPAEENKTEE